MAQLDLQQAQVGKETTWGTSVAATAKLMDLLDCKLDAGVEATIVKTRAGSLGSGHLAALRSIKPKGTYKGVGTYEDILYWIESLCGVATPGGAGPYTRSYLAPLTAVPTSPRMHSFYYGNTSDGVYKMLGTLATKMAIKIESNKEVEYDVDFLGKSMTTGALAGLSDRTLNLLMGNDFTVYLDTWGGTIGSTVLALTSFSASLEIDAKRSLMPFLGALGPGGYGQPQWEGVLKLNLEFNATSKAFYEAILNAGAGALFQKQVRLKGTTGASAILQFDFAGTNDAVPQIHDERDGMCSLEIVLQNQYNPTLSNWLKIDSTNSVSALP